MAFLLRGNEGTRELMDANLFLVMPLIAWFTSSMHFTLLVMLLVHVSVGRVFNTPLPFAS